MASERPPYDLRNPMIHAILICFNNPEQTRLRWERDIRPGLLRTEMPWAVTCVDNSERDSPELETVFHKPSDDNPHHYIWNQGANHRYGGAINQALLNIVKHHFYPTFTLYACTRHGKMLDPTWVLELIQPMVNNPRLGMTGSLMGSNSPEGLAEYGRGQGGADWVKERFRFVNDDGTGHVPQHIQGGVFAARTSALMEHPYVHPFLHLYSDHFITWALLKSGYEVRDIAAVRSIWKETVKNIDGLKYIHDQSENQ